MSAKRTLEQRVTLIAPAYAEQFGMSLDKAKVAVREELERRNQGDRMTEDTTTTDQAFEAKVLNDEQLAALRVAEIRDQQGWDDDTLLALAERFITDHGLAGMYANYLEMIQRGEQQA